MNATAAIQITSSGVHVSDSALYELYVMNANGTEQTRLTNNPASDNDPAWSPDGTKIAFTRVQGGNAEIYAMNANGTDQTNLTNNNALDIRPDWQAIAVTAPTIKSRVPQTHGHAQSRSHSQSRSHNLKQSQSHGQNQGQNQGQSQKIHIKCQDRNGGRCRVPVG
ncbi:hypothetical protein OHA25_02530 [Nonomuraea sp. NBC_00507]|uniref:TolB family protein n=1 Tax=Nonomuraea sp. NBC_00507 TaxID=2976002 RepID=UPI002E19F4C6